MDRINGAGHVNHRFVAEDAENNIPPTEFTAEWFNGIQEEPLAVIEGVGMTPDVNDNTQLRQAIAKMIEARVGDYVVDTGLANAYIVAMNPPVQAYKAGLEVKFRVTHANTGASTLNAGAGAVALVRNDGAPLQPGDLPVNSLVSASCDGVNGPFLVGSIVLSQTLTQAIADARYALATGTGAIQGNSKNLSGWADGVSSTVNYWLDAHTVDDGNGNYRTGKNIFLAINLATVGANGIDSGTVAASACYSTWDIYNPTTATWAGIAALCPVLTGNTTAGSAVVTNLPSTASMRVGMPAGGGSIPAGSVIKTVDSGTQVTLTKKAASTAAGVSLRFVYDPVMPGGYTYKARIGMVFTDPSASKYPLAFKQAGNRVDFVVTPATNVASLPLMASGAAGAWSATAPTFVSVALGAFVPPTATRIKILLQGFYGNNPANNAAVAPNANYSGPASNNPAPVCTYMSASGALNIPGDIALESSNLFWVSQTAGGALFCNGWEDTL